MFYIGPDLISLLVFYHIEGHDEWSLELDAYDSDSDLRSDSYSDTESDSQIRFSRSTKRAIHDSVRSHPKKAHRTLAVELGPDYDRIQASMHKERQKRHREEDRDRRERKRQRHE